MTLPLVSVIFITFKRIDLLKKTYDSFLANTDYPREKLELILCDDGSPENIQTEMRKLKFDKYLFAKKNEGMAKNVNKGLIAASGEFIFQLQDDWICKGPKDYLKLGVIALKEFIELGIIRYRLGMNYPNVKISEFNEGKNYLNIMEWDQGYWYVTKFIYSDNPHLKKASLHREIGLYKSFNKMHLIEENFCDRFNSSKLFKAGYVKNYEEVFEHIGENFSLRRKELSNRIKDFIITKSFKNFYYFVHKRQIKK